MNAKASPQSRPTLPKKYKILRNKVTSRLRSDSIKLNEERINEAKNESEMWNIVKDVTNPRKEKEWILNSDSGQTTNEQEISDTFNKYFNTKIRDLKSGIDQNLVGDPLTKLEKKMKDSNLSFDLKKVNQKVVEKP